MKSALFWIVGAALCSCRGPEDTQPAQVVAKVRCSAVETRQWADLRTLRGVIAAPPNRDAVVSAQVPGRLLRVAAREGDAVSAGAVLAEVESGPLRDALRQAQAQLAQARAQQQAAASATLREEHLFERGISARQAVETARASLSQADGAVLLANTQIDIARRDLERTTVRSPLTGVVVRLLRREGEVVDGTPATAILEVVDISALELAATVSVTDLVALRQGQRATVRVQAVADRTFQAEVLRVAPAIDTASGLGAVHLSLQTGDARLPLGAFASAEVAVTAAVPVTVVPSAAIRNAGGAKTELIVCAHGRAQVRSVVLGDRREGLVSLAGGLTSDELPARVVTHGLTGLEDGAAIQEAP